MCGIAGIVSLESRPIEPAAIRHMCNAIAHRGPDDAGYAFFHPGRTPAGKGAYWSHYSDEEFRHDNEHLPVFGGDYWKRDLDDHDFMVAIGHRRLSILDLSSYGHQPMCSADRRYWITHNGEIYNFPQLKSHLEARGYIFQTRTDTEVILYLWEEYGLDSLDMLDGMFAFAIYDRVENNLTLARDRFGVKPLYYAQAGDRFGYASEIKSLFAGGIVEAELYPPSLVEYCTFQNVFSRNTIWKDVQLLQPGEFVTLTPGSGQPPRVGRFHRTAFDPGNLSQQEAVGLVSSSFGKAVHRQLISDVPVGAFLSGGMDSGSIVAVAGSVIDRLYTFTAGFDLTNVNGLEQGYDERALAEQLSYLLQTEHYAVVLHAGDMPAAMERLTWHMDDPRVGMCHQNWYVAKLASRFVKVCLAGTGGDELFAGYPWRYRNAFLAQDVTEFDDALFRSWHRLLTPEELPRLFASELQSEMGIARASFDAILDDAPKPEGKGSKIEQLIARNLYFEFRTFLHGLLVTEDHISMAHGLETRVPFLDNDLAALAWKLPPSIKLRLDSLESMKESKYIDSTEGKYILRQAMEEFLPREYLHQKKQGFSPPDENWYRGPSMEYIKSILLDRQTRERPWFDQGFVESKLQEHFEGRHNHRLLIWSLLSVEWIQRHFADASNARQVSESVVIHAEC